MLEERNFSGPYGGPGAKIDAQTNIHAGWFDHAPCYRDRMAHIHRCSHEATNDGKINNTPLKSLDRSLTCATTAALTICFRTDFIRVAGPQEKLKSGCR